MSLLIPHKIPSSWSATGRCSLCDTGLASEGSPAANRLPLVGLCLLTLLVLATLGSQPAPAQDAVGQDMVAAENAAPAAPVRFVRPAGDFLNPLKIGAFLLCFLAWVYTADWVNRDCKFSGMPYVLWNMLFVFPCFVVFLFALIIPYFIVGFFLIIVALGIPLTIYVIQRNARVLSDDRVLTPRHIWEVLSGKGKKRSGGVDGAPADRGPPVSLRAMGADSELMNKANLLAAKQSPGYLTTREVLYDALTRRADKILLDYTPEMVRVQLEIDGVWHDAGMRERESGDLMLEVMKKIADLNIEDRRSRQTGRLGTALRGGSHTWDFVSQGTKTGERAVLQTQTVRNQPNSLQDLGMRPKLIELLNQLMRSSEGIIIFSSLPGGGLSTTLTAALHAADRFTRHFVSFEDETRKEPEVDNIEINTYRSTDGQSPTDELTRLFRTQPDVVVAPHLADGKIVDILCHHATDEKLIIATIRAKEAVEALLRVLMLKVSPDAFAPVVGAVINQRLIRKLCDSCKEAYTPPPDLLKKLDLPSGRVDTFYREPQNRSEEEDVCSKCGGIGYHGRTSIFEILVVDAKIREVLEKQAKIDILRKMASNAGNRTLQEEGIVLVARGITSLAELQRVLKQ